MTAATKSGFLASRPLTDRGDRCPMPDFRPLRAWAGATLLAETEIAIDRPHVWGTQADIERLRRKIDVWAREARIQ